MIQWWLKGSNFASLYGHIQLNKMAMAKMPNLRHQNNPQLMDDVMVAKSTLKKNKKT